MQAILQELKELHSSCNPYCVVKSCKRGRCRIVLDIIEEIVCIDCDLCAVFGGVGRNHTKKPDFVILYCNSDKDISRWIVIEMKGRIDHPRSIVEQLQEGANVVAENAKFKIRVFPRVLRAFVVRDDKHVRSADLMQRYVSFLGRKTPVRFVKSVAKAPVKLSEVVN